MARKPQRYHCQKNSHYFSHLNWHFCLRANDIARNRSRVIFSRACADIFRPWNSWPVMISCSPEKRLMCYWQNCKATSSKKSYFLMVSSEKSMLTRITSSLWLPAATDVIKAIALIFFTSSYEESHTLNAPLTWFIQNGHTTAASWTKTLFKNTARSSALDFFKTESVALLQYSWNSLLMVLLRGSGNSSGIFGCSNVKLATVFNFFSAQIYDDQFRFIMKWAERFNATTRVNNYHFSFGAWTFK